LRIPAQEKSLPAKKNFALYANKPAPTVETAAPMSHLSTALSEIIARSYSGNASEFARATGVSSPNISRIRDGKFEPTLTILEALARNLHRHDRKQLLLAAARDRVPTAFQDEVFGDEDPASQLIRARLSPDLAAVIRYLESTVMNDETTAMYLRKIGEWVGILTPAPPKFPRSPAAGTAPGPAGDSTPPPPNGSPT
jgi:transcriptional regulator with XRE-family HTH domain